MEGNNGQQNIWASIVLYNPTIDMLRRNLEAALKQVYGVVMVDNGSKNRDEIEKLLQEENNERIKVIWNGENKGIAAALNSAVQFALDQKTHWLLTLDQDSVIPEGMVESYRKYTTVEKAGQLSCVFYDPQYPDYPLAKSDPLSSKDLDSEYAECYGCITSGCLMNVDIAKEIGMFDERLFIDSVDHDYSFRMRKYGYKVIRVNCVHMEHHLGNGKKKRFLFYTYMDYQYSPMRLFYQSRNGVYMLRTYKIHKKVFIKALLHCLFTSLLGGRWKAVGAFFKGFRAGMKMEVNHYAK